MTSTQRVFLGLKDFKYDEKAQDVSMVLHVANVGDIPVQIQLRNRLFDSVKVKLTFVRVKTDGRSHIKDLCDSTTS